MDPAGTYGGSLDCGGRVESSTRAVLQACANEAATPRCTLYCLPYAGGDSTVFWAWQRAFPASVRLVAPELPGRDGRPAAPLSGREIAHGIAADLRPPYAVFGHSMGARLAFEVVRELLRAGLPAPVRLYVGAAHPPQLPEPIARLANLDEDDFIDQLILRAGTSPQVRHDPEVRAAVLPALRTDLRWLQQYRYRHDDPLPVPVVALAGTTDHEVSAGVMLGWARHTRSWFRLHELVGDHLFLQRSPEATTGLLLADLADALDRVDGVDSPPPGPPDAGELHLWRTRGAPRAVLDRYGIAAVEPVGDGPYGTGTGPLWFARAHDRGVSLVGVGRHRIGVDVRRLLPIPDLDAFCARELTSAEWAEVAAEPEEEQQRAALRFAAVRRALSLAAGADAGPGVDLGPVVRPADPAAATWYPVSHTGERWWAAPLDLDGAVAAVVAPGERPPRLRYETVTGGER